MNEKTPTEQALESIRNSWGDTSGLSWEFIGQAILIIIVIAATAYVTKHAKKFKDKL